MNMRFQNNKFPILAGITAAAMMFFVGCGGTQDPGSGSLGGTADVERIEITNVETTLAPGDYQITARCYPDNSSQGFTASLRGAPQGVSLNETGDEDNPVYILTIGQNAIDEAEVTVSVSSTYDPLIRDSKTFTLDIPQVEYTMISTEAELRAIANDLSGNYMLANDITLTEDWVQLGDAEHQPDGAPVQPAQNPFKGILDGNGYSIKNINMTDTSMETGYDRGFFGRIDAAGVVRNIGFEGGSMTFRGWSGVVAAQNYGVIENVFTNVKIHTYGGCTAAFVVTNGGVIRNCYAIGETTSESTDQNQPGFIGVAEGSDFGCFADRETTGMFYFAGGRWHNGNEDWNVNKVISTDKMQTADTFRNAGWDETRWTLVDGQYPTLKHI